VNNALNNLSPSLLCVFTQYLHFYGLVRLPFHGFCSRHPKTDIPCSVLKPNFKSCRLCNGGHIASKQVSRYACLCILRTMRFCPTTYAISLLLQQFICIHLLKSHLMVFLPPFLYPFTTAALQLLQRRAVWQPHLYGVADTSQWIALPLLYHLYYSMLKNFGIL